VSLKLSDGFVVISLHLTKLSPIAKFLFILRSTPNPLRQVSYGTRNIANSFTGPSAVSKGKTPGDASLVGRNQPPSSAEVTSLV